jgi:hypothetical protein
VLLHSVGRLPEGYRHGIGGFDEFLTTTIGLERDAFVAYIESARPDYLTLERWVREHATNLTAEAIATVNHRMETYEFPEAMRAERLARLRLQAEGADLRTVPLNDLDDWLAMHEALTAARD